MYILIWITFLVVVVILIWKGKPVIQNRMNALYERVHNDLKRAEEAAGQAAKAESESKRLIAEAQDSAKQIVADAKIAAERVREKIMGEIESEQTLIQEKALDRIALAKRKAVEDFRRAAIDMSIELTQQLMAKGLSAKDHEALIQRSLTQYESMKN